MCAAHVMGISRGACRCKGGGRDALRCPGRSNDDHVPFGGARAEFVEISAARPPWGMMRVVRRDTWCESACVAGMPMGVATRGEAAQVTWSRGSVGCLRCRCVVIAAMVERAWGAGVVMLARRGCRCVMCAAAFGRVCVGAIRRGYRCVMCAAVFGRVMARSVVMLARRGVPRGVAAGQPPVGRMGAAGDGGRVGAAIVARVAGDGCGVERALSRRRV